MYTRNKVNLTITTILLVSALIIMLAPFYFIVVNSFKPLSEIAANGFALPKHFSLENYFVAWNRIDFGNALKNTTIITLLANVGPILFGSMAGYWFTRHPNKITQPIYMFMIGSMAIPFQAVMIPFAKVTALYRSALQYRAMIPASGPTAFWHFSAACSLCLQRRFWTLLRCRQYAVEVDGISL